MQLGIKGALEGTLVLAETQTKGRGRRMRKWHSPKYKGIYLSLILKPKIALSQAPILTLLCAVSVCEAIKEITGLDTRIKWPNDILIANKKLGGILTEMDAETDGLRFVVLGLGLNVNNDKKTLIEGSTSLREQSGDVINRIDLLKALLVRIEKNYLNFQKKGSHAVTDKWREYNITLHRRVRVAAHKKQLEGQAIDIDDDGALLLRLDSGIIRKVTSGDVAYCR